MHRLQFIVNVGTQWSTGTRNQFSAVTLYILNGLMDSRHCIVRVLLFPRTCTVPSTEPHRAADAVAAHSRLWCASSHLLKYSMHSPFRSAHSVADTWIWNAAVHYVYLLSLTAENLAFWSYFVEFRDCLVLLLYVFIVRDVYLIFSFFFQCTPYTMCLYSRLIQ